MAASAAARRTRLLLGLGALGLGGAGLVVWQANVHRAGGSVGERENQEYARVLLSTPDRYTDAELLTLANEGNPAASDALVLRRSPLVERLGEGTAPSSRGARQSSLDVTRDVLLRPIPADVLVREITERGTREGHWEGYDLQRLWRLEPETARELAMRGARDPRSSWFNLAPVIRLERDSLRAFGEAYLRSHGKNLTEPEIAARIEALAWNEGNQDPTYYTPNPATLTAAERARSVPSPPFDAKGWTIASATRLAGETVAFPPRGTREHERWDTRQGALTYLVARDPVRALTIVPRDEKRWIADAIQRARPSLTATTLPALTATVRAHRTDSEWAWVRWSPLAYLLDPAVRRDWDRPLAGRYAQDRMDELARIWPRLEPGHRERLLALAARPRHYYADALARALIPWAPRDPRIVEFVGWALRTPKYQSRSDVAFAAAAQGLPEALAIVRAAIASPNPLVRADSARGLHDPKNDALSAPLLRDPSPYVRNQAAMALLDRDDATARARAKILRADPDPDVRATAERLESERAERTSQTLWLTMRTS